MKHLLQEPPVGIIITLTHKFIYDEFGYDKFIKAFVTFPNSHNDWQWCHTLSGRPKYDICYLYSLWDGYIRYRSQILDIEPGSTKRFSDGKILTAKAWAVLGGPVIAAPEPIPMKGVQGFRYTRELF